MHTSIYTFNRLPKINAVHQPLKYRGYPVYTNAVYTSEYTGDIQNIIKMLSGCLLSTYGSPETLKMGSRKPTAYAELQKNNENGSLRSSEYTDLQYPPPDSFCLLGYQIS